MTERNDPSAAGPGPKRGSPGSHPSGFRPSIGLRNEVKDAVRPHAVVLMLGVLILQLAFVVSYVGAFHMPRPSRIPVAVVAPARTQAALIDKLNSIPGRPISSRPAVNASQARAMVLDREV